MTIVIVFDSGYEVRMKCNEFALSRGPLGDINGYEAKGITENKILEFNPDHIVCVYRVMSDEGGDGK